MLRESKVRPNAKRTRRLVLNVNTGSTLLDEHLGQLHDGGQSSVSSIGISNERSQVINVGSLGSLFGSEVGTVFSLLSVVEELGHEEVLDFEGNSVGRVICPFQKGSKLVE